MEDRRVFCYDKNGAELGYIRFGQDEIGQEEGEIYNTQANRLGAVRFQPATGEDEEVQVFEQDGDQVGYVRLERYEDGSIGGKAYWTSQMGGQEQRVLFLHADGAASEIIVIRRSAKWGEELGTLRPEIDEVELEEAILGGGGAALFLVL